LNIGNQTGAILVTSDAVVNGSTAAGFPAISTTNTLTELTVSSTGTASAVRKS